MSLFEQLSIAAAILAGLWAVGAALLGQWHRAQDRLQDTEKQNIELRARRAEEQLEQFRKTVDRLTVGMEKHSVLISHLDKGMAVLQTQVRNLAEAFKSVLKAGYARGLSAQDLNGGEAQRFVPGKKKP